MDRSVTLRAGAVMLAGVTFVGAVRFTLEHPKNPEAPLQPPAADDVAIRAAPAPGSPAPTASGLPRATQPPRGTPPPKITLQPGVRATELPGITYTHVS